MITLSHGLKIIRLSRKKFNQPDGLYEDNTEDT
jgi:hypothetical protein